MTTKKEKTEPEPEQPKGAEEPKEVSALEAMVAAQQQQIAELMKAINQGGLPQAFDPSQSQFERERRAETERLQAAMQRTPEKDADTRLVWVGDRYQVRPVPKGYVPVEEVPGYRPPEKPKGAVPGRSALPAGLVVPGDLQRAGG